jgi:peptidyl-dipeptidase Dcp
MTAPNKNSDHKPENENPFLTSYSTPFQAPPFDKIRQEHFMPAFLQGMEQQQKRIAAIYSQQSAPTFENTIEALEQSSEILKKVSSVFFNLNSAHTSPEMEQLAQQIAPQLSQHGDDIYLNQALFKRVQILHDQRNALNLSAEQNQLLEKTYKAFVRSGADLDATQQARMREINKKISVLTVQFGQNLLAETNKFELLVSRESDLAGLPASFIASAAQSAKNAGHEGKWRFTLHHPSITPFLEYADNRQLREQMYLAYVNRCNHDDEADNKGIVSEIASLRAERAALLGYASHAHYVLEESMAKTPDRAFELLHDLWKAALPIAEREAGEMQKVMDREQKGETLEAWDWAYYADKVRKEKYNYNAEELKPYFRLENVRDGIFTVANKLYGLTFQALNNTPKYHEDAVVYEVKEADGTHVGLLYMDFFTRPSKRGGAWMTSYRRQAQNDGKRRSPIISIVCNYPKPVGGQPTLLTADEVETFFHEFGHALHGLLSNVKYETLSGTSVPRDFVELPSQIMEHWAFEHDSLQFYAKHDLTGEEIPAELVDKMKRASEFNQGFATVEYLAAALLDMGYHTLQSGQHVSACVFEKEEMDKLGLIRQIAPRYRSTYFQHIFSGGYSAGYYSYIWSEVLDSDAFAAFKEAGNIFDPAVSASFRENILEKGGTTEPMTLYKAFRGREPDVKFLLESRGLNKI